MLHVKLTPCHITNQCSDVQCMILNNLQTCNLKNPWRASQSALYVIARNNIQLLDLYFRDIFHRNDAKKNCNFCNCILHWVFAFSSDRSTLMGSLGVWVLAMATLLGALATWSADGHQSSRRSSLNVAGVSHSSSVEQRSAVSVDEKNTQTMHPK